jgi:hypothetical protein
MVAQLRAPWEAAERRNAKSGRHWEVGSLLSMLLYYRCYVTQEFNGFLWQVDRSDLPGDPSRDKGWPKAIAALSQSIAKTYPAYPSEPC